jgi:hypothetical protein
VFDALHLLFEKGVIAGQTDKPLGIWSRDPKDPDQIVGPDGLESDALQW